MADDIFALLKADHDRHREMLRKLDAAAPGSGEQHALFDAFRIEVSAHADAEEQSLYATMMSRPALQDESRHSVSEHKEIDDYLGSLAELDSGGAEWREAFDAMRHRYEHHIDEEEEEMFVDARARLDGTTLKELAAHFRARKPAELASATAEVAQSG